MEFNLREYIKEGLLDAVGKMSDYQVILNSAGWLEKGVLLEEDLAEIKAKIAEIKAKIAEKNTAENTPSSVENSVESTEIQEEILTEEPLILE